MIKYILICAKIIGFIIGSITLESRLEGQYSVYLLLYSLISFIAFFTEMGVFYSSSNQKHTILEIKRKIGRVCLASFFMSVATVSMLYFLEVIVFGIYLTVFLLFTPLLINLNALFKGLMVYNHQPVSVAALDAAAFGLPGFLFFFWLGEFSLEISLAVILTAQLFALMILYALTLKVYNAPLYPIINTSYSKFEKQMLYSNMFAAPIGHLDLWAINYLVPTVENSTLLIRDLASKVPNVFFPILQIILYPKMIMLKNKRLANILFDRVSSRVLMAAFIPLIFVATFRFDLELYFQAHAFLFDNILIILLFSFRTIGSFVGPLMMLHNRSDLSLVRNIFSTCSLTLVVVMLYALNLELGVNMIYSAFLVCLVVLSILDFIIVQKIFLHLKSAFSRLYFALGITVLYIVLSGGWTNEV